MEHAAPAPNVRADRRIALHFAVERSFLTPPLQELVDRLVHGCRYPRWRGGLMHDADTALPEAIAARISSLPAAEPLS